MKALVEYTDTFGGDANYSWVDRYEFNCDHLSDLAIVRRAKARCGLSGVAGRGYWNGDYEFRPYYSCTVMFITFES